MLRGGNALVAENFGKAFDGHVVAEGYRGGEGVTSDVKGELFGDATMQGDFRECTLNPLVANEFQHAQAEKRVRNYLRDPERGGQPKRMIPPSLRFGSFIFV